MFVTGTDTGVGKTTVTAVLAAAARQFGTVIAAKPVESGVSLGIGEDAQLLGAAGGHPPEQFVSYQAPLSPHRAAKMEGRTLDTRALAAWVSGLSADTILVEGAGGWRVPLTDRYDIADLAQSWGAPVLIVAADRLGVLNHTRMTMEAVLRDGCSVAGVALVRSPTGSGSTNLEDLRELIRLPVLDVPRILMHSFNDLATISIGLTLWRDLP